MATHSHTEATPPRRTGRRCGYPGQDDLLNARAQLAAALTALARDPDPTARQRGADIATEATDTLNNLTAEAKALADRS